MQPADVYGGGLRVNGPKGLSQTFSSDITTDPADAAARFLRWLTGLEIDEIRADELEFLGNFDGTRHYRFHV